MKVRLVQSGGVTGLVREAILDDSSLPPDLAQTLRDLVRSSGLSSSVTVLSPTGRDLHQYQLTLAEGDFTVDATFDQETLPAAMRPLVAFLRQYLRPVVLSR